MALTQEAADRIRRRPDHERKVVVALGAHTNIGHSWQETANTIWTGNTSNAVNLVKNPPYHAHPQVDHWDDLEVQAGIPLKAANMREHFTAKQLAVSDLSQHIGAKAALEAVRGAGYWDEETQRITPDQRTAVIMATAVGGTLRLTQWQHIYEELLAERAELAASGGDPNRISLKRPLRNAATQLLPGQVASFVGTVLDARAVKKSVSTECSGGGTALDEAMQELSYNHGAAAGLGFYDPRARNTELVVVGAAEVGITRMSYIVFNAVLGVGAITKRNDDPGTASRPWDRDVDGFNFGEGSIVLAMQRLSDVKKHGREDKIIGEVLSVAHVSDPRSANPIFPSSEAVTESYQDSLHQGGVTPEMVDANIAHATSTGVSEVTDSIAIMNVFEGHASRMPTISTKGISGHLLAASTLLNLAVGLEAGRRGELPPNWNLFNRNPQLPGPDKLWLPTTPTRGRFQVITAGGSGFGGNNALITALTEYLY